MNLKFSNKASIKNDVSRNTKLAAREMNDMPPSDTISLKSRTYNDNRFVQEYDQTKRSQQLQAFSNGKMP